ncbi:MAG: hypothetical protein U5R48_13915 [Gammaproteobacteria bacterium]|nr:hypothetical protein [Gammaproteobacteria bacterium]
MYRPRHRPRRPIAIRAFLDAEGRFDQALWEARNYPPRLEEYVAQERIVPFWVMSGDHDTFDIAYHAAALYQALREHQPDRDRVPGGRW